MNTTNAMRWLRAGLVALAVVSGGCGAGGDAAHDLDEEAAESVGERTESGHRAVPDAAAPREGGSEPGPDERPDEPAAVDAGSEQPAAREDAGDAAAPGEAVDPTHGRIDPPNYEVVFPAAKVNQITFTIAPDKWQTMMDDMTALWGPRDGAGRPPAMQGGDRGLGGFPAQNPVYVPATVSFDGLTWENVGVRFKGNSSLRAAWSSNTDRFPLRVDFDEFEDDHPESKNQRFYGFKQLSLSTNVGDATHMRETLFYDLLEEREHVTPARGFYEVYLDRGEGPKSLGLYTVLEIVRETVIPRHFADPSGNLYKAENSNSSLAAGTREAIRDGYEREGGPGRSQEQADWSDIEALYDALHAPERTSDASAWRSELESRFDVSGFLRWLAFSALLQHWDTYGAMPHNYYLYNDPMTQTLRWISWDHNFVLGSTPGGGRGFGGRFGSVPFDKSSVGASWPLISFLYADASYRDTYDAELLALVEGAFEPSKVKAAIDSYAALLSPTATKEVSDSAYAASVQALKDVVDRQVSAARSYLGR